MRRFRTWLLLLAATLTAGCSMSRRPYAGDPLLRQGRGVWGNPARQATGGVHAVEPQAPVAPTGDDLTFIRSEIPESLLEPSHK
jgi:hypothetical protein